MTQHKSATELLAEMEALKLQLALTMCRCCGRPLNIFVQPGMLPTSPVYRYGTCFQDGCKRFSITRELHDLYTLTEAQVATFQQPTVNE